MRSGVQSTTTDMPAVRKIVREAAEEDYRFSSLVWEVVESEPFRMRRIPAKDDGAAAPPVTAQNAQ